MAIGGADPERAPQIHDTMIVNEKSRARVALGRAKNGSNSKDICNARAQFHKNTETRAARKYGFDRYRNWSLNRTPAEKKTYAAVQTLYSILTCSIIRPSNLS